MKKISRLSFPEKREYFGIRKLKVGVASVAIATTLFWGAGLTNVSADQISSQTPASEVVNETSLPEDDNQSFLELEKTDDVSQNLEEKNLLNNTVIIVFTDHYLYTLEDKTLLEKYKETK